MYRCTTPTLTFRLPIVGTSTLDVDSSDATAAVAEILRLSNADSFGTVQ